MSKESDIESAIARLRKAIDAMPYIRRLRASHDRLLAAAKEALNLEYWDQDGFEPHASKAYNDLQAAITAAEELGP